MLEILMISAKLATLVLHKIKVFWNKSSNIIISVNYITIKILSRDSNDNVDVVMWPKFDNKHFYERIYHNLNFRRIWLEK